MNLDQVRPLTSVGGLKLGLPESSVRELLGTACTRRNDEIGHVELEYEYLGIVSTFWESDEFRLGVVEVVRHSASIYEHELMGSSKDEVVEFGSTELEFDITDVGGVEHEDSSVQEWIDISDIGLMFWFQDNELYRIGVLCDWLDVETPKWPV